MRESNTPPKLFLQFLRWFCHPQMLDFIEGDLHEFYQRRLRNYGKRSADILFVIDVILLLRPGIIKPADGNHRVSRYGMYKSYFKVGWRSLLRDKGYSFINIGGLALGIAIAMLIGLWVYDELSFNRQHEHFNDLAVVMQHNTVDGEIDTYSSQSYQLGSTLRSNYDNLFRRVVMATFATNSILGNSDKIFGATGMFMESEGPELLSLQMIRGHRDGLINVSSLMLSESVANNLFGTTDVVGRSVRIDDREDLQVVGVFRDIPSTSDFKGELGFVGPLQLVVNRGGRNFGWVNNWLQVFVQVEENLDMQQVSAAIGKVKLNQVSESDKRFKPELFLHPMSRWHLYSEFKNGVNAGGRIDFVWLFAIIGGFILLLACINFMNLCTARAQKRSKEVGVRKVIGSRRGQIITQFLIESLLIVTISFILSMLIVQTLLPWFNELSSKSLTIHWNSLLFWITLSSSIILISFIAGSYPSFHLSAFNPVKVLKGTWSIGRHASLPRKALVIIQFTVSIILIIGTVVVYQQIQFAKDRPLGYNLNGLLTIPMKTPEIKKNYNSLRNELLSSGKFSEVSTSETTATNMWWSDWGFQWRGKDPNMQDMLYRGAVDYEFGESIGWKIKAGRDFSRDFVTDSTALILNEAAVKYMGFESPIGEIVQGYGKNYTVIGVVEDMVTQSLYEPNKQTIFLIDPFGQANYINVRIVPQASTTEALSLLNSICAKYNPNTPFEYTFADSEFAEKFSFEARTGKLVGIFSTLAISISCLGLFGLAAFVAEQRTKEIGIRKVMGASVASVWSMLSRDFAILVIISCAIAIPFGYYLMGRWLASYTYRTPMPWWIFAATGIGALLIALLTVSYQAIKAALINPVRALRAE
ncbi:MAG: ABC transporter permease [Chryseolinea sp.]